MQKCGKAQEGGQERGHAQETQSQPQGSSEPAVKRGGEGEQRHLRHTPKKPNEKIVVTQAGVCRCLCRLQQLHETSRTKRAEIFPSAGHVRLQRNTTPYASFGCNECLGQRWWAGKSDERRASTLPLPRGNLYERKKPLHEISLLSGFVNPTQRRLTSQRSPHRSVAHAPPRLSPHTPTHLLVETVLGHKLGRVALVFVRHRPPPVVAVDDFKVRGISDICAYQQEQDPQTFKFTIGAWVQQRQQQARVGPLITLKKLTIAS